MGKPSVIEPSRGRSVAQALLAVVSVLLNIFLAAYLLHSRPSFPTPTTGPASAQPVTNPSRAPAITDMVAATPGTTTATTNPSSFRWAEIESADYRQYVANLRAVGCPEQIIRDIIVADMNQLFSARAQAIWKPRVTEYWQKPVNDRPGPQQMEQLGTLDKEKRAAFQDLLGVRPSQQELIDTLYLQVHGSEQQLLFLPADKRKAALQALNDADFEVKEAKLYAQDGYSQAAQEKLFAEKVKVLAGVLSPEELEEFRLRHSQTAQSLRMEVEYFNCTPDEFKTLFAACEQKADGKSYGPDLLNRTAATEEVRKLFGDERAKEFERVSDLFYINIRRPAEEQGIALSLVDQAWQVTRDARTAAEQAARNTSLAAEERKRQVQALRRQAESRLTELLGEKASQGARRDLRNVLGVSEANIKP
jgi:hypothetical protein